MGILVVISAVAAPVLVSLPLRPSSSRCGHCDRCGYNLTGNTRGICPECGLDLAARAAMRARNEQWLRPLAKLTGTGMLALGCWWTLTEIRDVRALEFYRENPYRLLAVLVLAFIVGLVLWLAARARLARYYPPAAEPTKDELNPIYLVAGMVVLLVGTWTSDLPNWILALAAVVVFVAYGPPWWQQHRALVRLAKRPAASLSDEYEEVMRRSGLDRSAVETLWGELAAFHHLPASCFRARDQLASDLSGIVGHVDNELFLFEPKILVHKAAQSSLAGVKDWADLIIAIHAIRHSSAGESVSIGKDMTR